MKFFLFTLLLSVAAAPLSGARTATWEMHSYTDFISGRFEGISLSRDGRLMLAPKVDTVFSSDQPVVWSVAQAADGTLYAGTGHRGRVFRIDPSGKSSVLWTADQPEVFAIALDPKGVLYAATSPEGRIYRIENGQAVEFFAPNTIYIWSLVFADDGTLYVGTGNQGQVFRVDPSGKGEIYYETGQSHVTALAFDREGRLLAGTEPNGILYRVSEKDKAFVLYDAEFPEIRSIVTTEDGTIYAAAMGGGVIGRGPPGTQPRPGAPARPQATATTSITVTGAAAQGGVEIPPRPDPATSAQPGGTPQVTSQVSPVVEVAGVDRSALYKIWPDHTVERLWSSKEENVYDLLPSGDHMVFSTDGRGRIYRMGPDRRVTLLVQTNEGEATKLVETSGGLLAATGNLGKILRLGESAAARGVYESPVHDAGTVARWGRLKWRANGATDGRLVFHTRTGNSSRPDNTWSDWSEPLSGAEGAGIPSPNARYIQWKAEFAGTGAGSPILDGITIAYLPQNTPPTVKSIRVSTQAVQGTGSGSRQAGSAPAASGVYSITVTDSGDAGPATSAGTPTQVLSPVTVRQMQISWEAEDPDNDRLIYALHFRGEDEKEWKLIKEDFEESSFLLDGDVLADGRYFFRVRASDLLDNPPPSAREAELVSAPVLIDNTPPLVRAGTPRREGSRVEIEFEAEDATSVLRRAEYSLNAGTWIPVEAADGIFDSRQERFIVRLDGLPPGEHLVVVRVYDAAGQAGLAKIVLR